MMATLVDLGLVNRTPRRQAIHRFLCVCGKEFSTHQNSVKRGLTKSCGCLKSALCSEATFKHGHHLTRQTVSPTYISWAHMRQRCDNEKDTGYRNYGGRGIKVHPAWNDFRKFLEDMGERPPGTTIDRIETDGNYEPGNCRWADAGTQSRNRRFVRNGRAS